MTNPPTPHDDMVAAAADPSSGLPLPTDHGPTAGAGELAADRGLPRPDVSVGDATGAAVAESVLPTPLDAAEAIAADLASAPQLPTPMDGGGETPGVADVSRGEVSDPSPFDRAGSVSLDEAAESLPTPMDGTDA